MATRQVKTGSGDYYCVNGDAIKTAWETWVRNGEKNDEVICCDVDPDYLKTPKEVCFKLSDITSIGIPNAVPPSEPPPQILITGGNTTITVRRN